MWLVFKLTHIEYSGDKYGKSGTTKKNQTKETKLQHVTPTMSTPNVDHNTPMMTQDYITQVTPPTVNREGGPKYFDTKDLQVPSLQDKSPKVNVQFTSPKYQSGVLDTPVTSNHTTVKVESPSTFLTPITFHTVDTKVKGESGLVLMETNTVQKEFKLSVEEEEEEFYTFAKSVFEDPMCEYE